MSVSELSQPYVALVGSPNSGKTSLFNALTGGRQRVGNYPGVTVERKEGSIERPGGHRLKILDLPGTYTLDANTLDEAVTRGVLLTRKIEGAPPDLLVAVADATNLERSLSLVLELKELGFPMVLVLNMMDLARSRGLAIDLETLSRELGMPVFPVVAVKKEGLDPLLEEMLRRVGKKPRPLTQTFPEHTWTLPRHSPEEVRARYREIDRILNRANAGHLKPARWTDRIDRAVLHPLWGSLLLVAILTFVFQSIFNWASYPMDLIERGIGLLSEGLRALLPQGWLQNLLIDGVLAGVGSVVVFLPQILMIFFFILLLEDSGYMARAAFLMDRQMGRVGLHGRAFIPLLSSFACAIPGIMAARTIENPRDRLTTILISPLMACSARLPVYTLLISAFIPNSVVWGPFRLQGLVMLGLYALGLVTGLIVAWIFKKAVFRGPTPTFLLELPTYKWPSLRNVLIGMWERARLFLRRAGTVILAVSVAIWFLSSYPKPPADADSSRPAITYSLAGRIGHVIEPVIRPIGFDWSIGIGLLTGMAAREVIVGTLATVYSVEDGGAAVGDDALGQILQRRWSLATGLSLLVYFVFAMQCFSTLAVVRRETNSWKWPAVLFLYLTGLAYLASFVTYRLTLYLSA
ncbi:ferrous iron transport protein B [Deltaproteobacteria bacterium PRO3]|nr:ferrous iron transport protein B [Deltaproteobacteria bacterium PRO3]